MEIGFVYCAQKKKVCTEYETLKVITCIELHKIIIKEKTTNKIKLNFILISLTAYIQEILQ